MSTPATPGLVSIVMPFLDTPEAFLTEAVASIERQTYRHWELILVDDGSGEPIAAAARRLAARAPDRVRCLAHGGGENLGISASRNLALSVARGEYVAFLDADDVWDPGQLEEQVGLLRREPAAMLLYGNTTYWHSWDGGGEDFEYKLGVAAPQLHEPPRLLERILKRRAISPCMTSILVRRAVFDDGIAFDPAFRVHYEDQVFLARVLMRYPVFVSERCWGRYRQHHGSTTGGDDHSALAKKWRLRYLDSVAASLDEQGLRGTAVWRTLRLERWMLGNRRAERAIERLRLWKRRARKLLGTTHAP